MRAKHAFSGVFNHPHVNLSKLLADLQLLRPRADMLQILKSFTAFNTFDHFENIFAY